MHFILQMVVGGGGGGGLDDGVGRIRAPGLVTKIAAKWYHFVRASIVRS